MQCALSGSTVTCTGGIGSLVTWTACTQSDPQGCLHPQPVTGAPTGTANGAPCGGSNRMWNGKCLPDECTKDCPGASPAPATTPAFTCGANSVETEQGCQQVAPNCPAGTGGTDMCEPDSTTNYADCFAAAKWQAAQPEIGIHVIWQNGQCKSYIGHVGRWW
jgi:hypothetical protein